MRSLEKDRTRRYETANDFAADILRFLDDEPVIARPPSRVYRLKKMMRRNKAVFATGGLIAAVLVVATALSLFFGLSEQQQRRIAETALEDRDIALAAETKAKEEEAKRAEELEQVTEFQQERLADIDVARMGLQIRAELLEKVRAAGEWSKLSEEEIDERVNEVERLIAGADFTGLALAALDENIFDRALEAIGTQFDDQPLIKASLLHGLGGTYLDLGLTDQAFAPLEEALAIHRRELGNEHENTMTSVGEFGILLALSGKYDEAMPYYVEALEARRRVLGDAHSHTLISINAMGDLLQIMGQFDRAMPYYREALDTTKRVLGPEHKTTLQAM